MIREKSYEVDKKYYQRSASEAGIPRIMGLA